MYEDKPSLDELMHYGMPRRSGRYPWGSGDDPYQHSGDFLSRVNELRKQGFTFTDEHGNTFTGDTAIAKSMNLNTTQFRTQLSLANEERRQLDVARAKSLRSDGKTLKEIAEIMGFKNDSSVRSLLNEQSEARMNEARKTAEILKKMIDEKGMIDVGTGAERELGVSKEKLAQALYILELDGYPVYGGGAPQVTNPGKQTILKVVCPPGTEHREIYNFENIHPVTDYISYDGGETFKKSFVYPSSMDSKRVYVRYGDEVGPDGFTGESKDGTIELRRNVADLSLGNSRYAQVRILIDDKMYAKGMALYSDDIPDGYDMVFNTNKKKGTPYLSDDPKEGSVFKKIKSDPDNPFGATIKEHGGQSYYIDKDGKEKLSLINKAREEGDWSEWSDHLPAQFLSKQSISLIRKQLNLAIADKYAEYDEICALTNPTVKKVMLKSFSEDCDSAAVHLQAAALPRQKYQVILPLNTLKDNEIYAPNYSDGEQLALIRFPHGGTFEIPILTVNNRNAEGKTKLGTNPKDAVGINSKNAVRLSGADFDGDTVMVIPTGRGKVKITSTPPLKELEDFDAKAAYPYREGMKLMKNPKTGTDNTQLEMGKISNLITDMTLKGATDQEKARAVKHSMVVIDAAKHKLDYKRSEVENGIASLKKKYQGTVDENGRYHEGAATLISRSKSETSVLKRKGSPIINPDGSISYKEVRETYVDKTGHTKVRTQKSTKMAETKDARTLSSGTIQEEAYADYANKLKSLGNAARKTMINTGRIQYSSTAKQTYQNEYNSLMAKLNVSLKNAPKERQAQMMANTIISAKQKENPDMTSGEIKKAKQQALTYSRNLVGAKRQSIDINDREWEAIQAGAISETQLIKIIQNVDSTKLKERATPRTTKELTTAQIAKIKSMVASGYTNDQIAKSLNKSASTITKYLN